MGGMSFEEYFDVISIYIYACAIGANVASFV